MYVTPSGITIEAKLLQEAKVLLPILVNEFGRLIDTKLLQLQNACESILLIVAGSSTVLSFSQFLNALKPIEIVELPTMTFSKSLLFSKAYSPMLVTGEIITL